MLESRLVPYSVSGNAWPNPQLVTISFVPDGTILGSNANGYIYSNLFATFNNHPGWTTATWEKQILRAAQAWAQQTNINFAVVADNGAPFGSGNYQQGDPTMGDIRIGGYNMGSSLLATANMPPPANNYSAAGDITFNTGLPFNIGATYDLFSVAAHEFGHTLGLNEGTAATGVMYGTYVGAKSGLNCDDVAGARNIYSSNNPRAQEANDPSGNNTFASATNISALIDPTALTAQLTASINSINGSNGSQTTADVDYYTFVAPSATSSTLTVQVQSAGLSLLAPTLTIYAADQTTVLGSASGAGQYGATISATVSGVTAGEKIYVKVAGAETTTLGSGRYALSLNLGTGSLPGLTLPNTQTLNGSPLHADGGEPQEVNEIPGAQDSASAAVPAKANPNAAVVPLTNSSATPLASLSPQGDLQLVTAIKEPAAVPVPMSLAGTFPPGAPVSSVPLSSNQVAHSETTTGGTLTSSDLLPWSEEQAAPTTSPPDFVPLVPDGASGAVSAAVLEEVPAARGEWLEACDACFADHVLLVTPEAEMIVPLATEGSEAQGRYPALALAALALGLGGCWAISHEDASELKFAPNRVGPV
jgi:hypothetical protein